MQKDYSFVKDSTDAGIEFQLNYTADCIKNARAYPGLSMMETQQFHDALIAEDLLRWENGNKQKFQEMLIRTFGKSAVTV